MKNEYKYLKNFTLTTTLLTWEPPPPHTNESKWIEVKAALWHDAYSSEYTVTGLPFLMTTCFFLPVVVSVVRLLVVGDG